MSNYFYIPPSTKIKYGYFLHKGGDNLILWGHGSSPAYERYEDLGTIVKPEFESTIDIFSEYDATIIMPLLPRDRNSKKYPNLKMDAQILTQETMNLVEGVKPIEFFLRPDLEVKKIVDKEFGKTAKFTVGGISAGANMANRFSILHPNNIKGIILLLAGDFIYPTDRVEKTDLKYPFGLADINQIKDIEVDLSKYKNIPQFVFVGENDNKLKNDPLPFELYNNKGIANKMKGLLGTTQIDRTKHYAAFLKANGYKVTLSIGKGIGHGINNQTVEELRNWVSNDVTPVNCTV